MREPDLCCTDNVSSLNKFNPIQIAFFWSTIIITWYHLLPTMTLGMYHLKSEFGARIDSHYVCYSHCFYPDSKFHGANMVLSAPGWPHVGHVNLAIWVPPRVTSCRRESSLCSLSQEAEITNLSVCIWGRTKFVNNEPGNCYGGNSTEFNIDETIQSHWDFTVSPARLCETWTYLTPILGRSIKIHAVIVWNEKHTVLALNR